MKSWDRIVRAVRVKCPNCTPEERCDRCQERFDLGRKLAGLPD